MTNDLSEPETQMKLPTSSLIHLDITPMPELPSTSKGIMKGSTNKTIPHYRPINITETIVLDDNDMTDSIDQNRVQNKFDPVARNR